MSNLSSGGLSRVLIYLKTWITGLLNSKSDTSHTHTKSAITDFPAYGTTAGTICQGNDSRLSDARTPYFANGTWYNVGDDVKIGDHNVGGALGICGQNDHTRIDFCQFNNSGNYKSITFDGTTLYMNGICDHATNAGNSDTLDGYHEYSFLRKRGDTSASGEGTLWAQIGIKEYHGALPDGLSGVYNWGEVVSMAGTYARFDIYCSHVSSDGGGLYYRSGWGDDKKAWNRINVENATYLNGYQIYVG